MTPTGETVSGFRLVEEREIDEIASRARLFEHIKSGARLLHLKNDDDNKVFSIAFRTPPTDSTGVPHILEHSVLCGSRKYPSKEPFVELLKGSLSTFLNAFTFPDKTVYPVASRNEKDLFNLVDVYLDAVLFPQLHETPEILMQEGWHYELDESGALVINGVVYNEMKGAFSSPEATLMRKIRLSLFPDTPYGVESGGDPDAIPNLTQERFTEFHKRFYHPSNSYIFAYGDLDLAKMLRFLDEQYLVNFERIAVESRIPDQAPFASLREVTDEYPLAPNESERDKTYLGMNFVVGYAVDPELSLALSILKHMLIDTPAAPLRKAIVQGGIGKDVLGMFESSIKQPIFGVIAKNSNLELKDEFREVVLDTLRDLVRNGIDKRMIEASINHREFMLREADFRGFPKGLVYDLTCLDSWLYDDDPTVHLRFEPVLAKIKAALKTDYFEQIIERYLLENRHGSLLTLKPSKGLLESRERELKEKLDRIKTRLSDAELKSIADAAATLKKRQQTPDPPEVVEKIPVLALEDIDPQAEELPLIERELSGVKVLSHPMFTNDIGYLNLYFDTSTVPKDLIPYLSLLADILGKMSTDRYEYGALSNEVNIHTGGIDFFCEAFSEKDDDHEYHPKLVVKSKALMRKLPKLLELIAEITTGTRFDDPGRVREVVNEVKSRFEMLIMTAGSGLAARRVLSYISPLGRYRELTGGISYYRFIADLAKDFDRRAAQVVENLRRTAQFVFKRDVLLTSFTAAEPDFAELQDRFDLLLERLSDERHPAMRYDFDLAVENEGLLTPSKVQYVVKGYNFRRLGYEYTGSMSVAANVIHLEYLWNKVRMQGGAYGAWPRLDRNGTLLLASFRDPNLKETLEAFDQTGAFLRGFDPSPREMTKYIIGTISDLDRPLTPSMKGEIATSRFLSHLTQEEVQREREQVMETDRYAVTGFADMVDQAMSRNYFAVLGGDGKIRENEGLFGRLVQVFE